MKNGGVGGPGPQGDQGNTGVIIDKETFMGTIVNNDTEGGEDKAWSAERGKVLRTDIEQRFWHGIISGKNNTFVPRLIYDLIPCHVYRLYFAEPNWDKTGITYGGGYAQFQIDSYDSSGTATNLVLIKLNQQVVSDYTFTIPSDSAYIRIGIRATSGTNVAYAIEDESSRVGAISGTADINKIAYNRFFLGRTIRTRTTNGVTLTRLSGTRVLLNGTATADTNFNLWGEVGDRYAVRANGFSAMMKSSSPSVTPATVWIVFSYFTSESGVYGGTGNAAKIPNRWYTFPSSAKATFGRPYIHIVSGTTLDNVEIEIISSDFSIPGELREKLFNSSYCLGADDYYTKCLQFSSLMLGTENDVTAPSECESFLFFTDPHLLEDSGYEQTLYEMVGQIQKYYNSTPTTFCLCGGDWLGNSDLPESACFKLGFVNGFMHSMFRNCVLLVGNHDTNYQGKKDSTSPSGSTRLSNQSIIDLWYRREGKAYFAYDGSNTRFYCFDTGTENQTMTAFDNYGWEQAEWFATSLLTDNSKHIAIAAHILYYSGTSVQPLTKQILQIAQAFNNRTSISVNGTTYDYSAKTGVVEFGIFGHLHRDGQAVLYDIPCILTINAATDKVAGASFDLVLADYDNRRINLVRVGSGSDRIINLVQ